MSPEHYTSPGIEDHGIHMIYRDNLVIGGGADSGAGQKNKASELPALKANRHVAPGGGGLRLEGSPENLFVHPALFVFTQGKNGHE